MHALSLALLHAQLLGGRSVLDVGSGSGYLATVMAAMVAPAGGLCTSFDSAAELCELARTNSKRAAPALLSSGCLRFAQGSWPEIVAVGINFDAIHIGVLLSSSKAIPPEALGLLKPGGRLLASVGLPSQTQRLVVIDRDHSGNLRGKLEPPPSICALGSAAHDPH